MIILVTTFTLNHFLLIIKFFVNTSTKIKITYIRKSYGGRLSGYIRPFPGVLEAFDATRAYNLWHAHGITESHDGVVLGDFDFDDG